MPGCDDPVVCGQIRQLAESTKYIAGHAVGDYPTYDRYLDGPVPSDELKRQLKQRVVAAVAEHVKALAELNDSSSLVPDEVLMRFNLIDESGSIRQADDYKLHVIKERAPDSAVLLQTTGDDE